MQPFTSLLTIMAAALAGGLGWGIRGQYGHETGAMIAGLLVGGVLMAGFCQGMNRLAVARALALTTVAIGIGGSMTYGQTIGLTQDAPLIGNWAALTWGMLGLSIKGAIWIGFAGLLLGHGLGGRTLRWPVMLLAMIGLIGLKQLGVWLINEPYDPSRKILPAVYFSDHWYWEPGADLKPRREVWGGLGLGLIAATLTVRFAVGDRLAMRMALWGMLGGAVGFPGGQVLQAYHAWNQPAIAASSWQWLDGYMNWWNVMETAFGSIMGTVLAVGLWWNRKLIVNQQVRPLTDWPPGVEWFLVVVHAGLLVLAEFGSVQWISVIYGDGLILATLPLVAIVAGRLWPYMLAMPLTALPILGKTLRHLVYKDPSVSVWVGWTVYLIIPLAITISLALLWSRQRQQEQSAQTFAPSLLFVGTWLFFGLNFAFFKFPFPWQAWTGRTPNGIFFTFAAFCLTLFAIATYYRKSPTVAQQSGE